MNTGVPKGERPKNLRQTLGADEFRRVADLRRELWTGGTFGLLSGAAVGLCAFLVQRRRSSAAGGLLHAKWGTALGFGGGALGMFLGAYLAGRENVYTISDILAPKLTP